MLILASASPRRHELLTAAGIEHQVQPTYVEEVRLPHESPHALVSRLAKEKADPVALPENGVVLGADTVVSVDDRIFGKPVDQDDAAEMLRSLSGRSHWVYTGICLRSSKRIIRDVASTEVFFLPLSEQAIQEYTRSGEYRDKAGAYAIQGRASRFVERIHGSYSNVVGLPVALVYKHLQELRLSENDSGPTYIP